MNEINQFITSYSGPLTFKVAVLSLLLAFGLAQLIGLAYIWTFRGMSYSRSFVHAVALGSIVACMLMLAINNSVAAGLGIAGSLAIIRFRTAMRDPRDMVFVFASMGAGIAAGLRAHVAALLGTLIFCAAVFLLTMTEFGSQRKYDGLLRFQLPVSGDDAVAPILKRLTRSFVLVTLRKVAQGESMEHAYQVQLDDQEDRIKLVQELEGVAGIQNVSLMLQEPTVEI